MRVTCDEAKDGVEACEMAQKNNYALILMDNVMPRMTGVEATRQIRSNDLKVIQTFRVHSQVWHAPGPHHPSYDPTSQVGRGGTLIFGLTGNALSEDVSEFKLSGCNEVLTKPLNTAKLREYLIASGL